MAKKKAKKGETPKSQQRMGPLNLKRRTVLIICIAWDFLDLVLGWIPIIGDGLDVLQGLIAMALFGAPGILAFWELGAFGPFNVVDAVIPTMTIMYFLIPKEGG